MKIIRLLLLPAILCGTPNTLRASVPDPESASTAAQPQSPAPDDRGIAYYAPNGRFGLAFRFRMQSLVGFRFDEDFTLMRTEAHIRRIRLRFDGYLYSPKVVYSFQLGFSPRDTQSSILRDAIVYYVPDKAWKIGLGQAKIQAARARINSSGALQLIDRSIVSGAFGPDRGFGLFGQYAPARNEGFTLSLKGSLTFGGGIGNLSASPGSYVATARLELYPLGRFKAHGEAVEGDREHEEEVRILLAGAGSIHRRATRLAGQSGDEMPDGATRNLGSYFADFVLKYRGFACCADFMGRTCRRPLFGADTPEFVYTGCGLNVQASYLIRNRWEVAVRNATLFPAAEVRTRAGYDTRNRTTLGVTRYLMGYKMKMQADLSYDHRTRPAEARYARWEMRFQLELGL